MADLQPFEFTDGGASGPNASLVGALESVALGASRAPGRGRGGGRGPGQHAARKPVDDDAKPGADFWDRILRGYNKTKIGSNTNPRDVAKQIAAQVSARSTRLPPATHPCLAARRPVL